jgi:phage terminase large subunit-like protein
LSLKRLKALEEYKKYQDEWKLKFYRPYPKQREFHELGSSKRERLFLAGNQLGKCVSGDTAIDRADWGPTLARELPREFLVWAWDGEKPVKAKACNPIQKPAEPLVRLYLRDGHLDCALGHRVLTEAGFASVGQLLAFVPCLPASDWGCGPSIHVSDALSFPGRLAGFLGRCWSDFHQCGERLHDWLAPCPAFGTQLTDALPRTRVSSRLGDQDDKYTNILQLERALPSSWYDRLRCAVRSVEFLTLASCSAAPRTTGLRRAIQPLSIAGGVLLRSIVARLWGRSLGRVRALQGWGGEGNSIIAYRPIGSQVVYDFSVPGFENYRTLGIFHHNTLSAGNETAYHATGVYPNWWRGKVFKKPIRGWFGSETAELARDGQQRILLGPAGSFGTGAIPKDCLIETMKARGVPDAVEVIRVKHSSGGISTLISKAYADGREKWQADTLDLVWFDEEPPVEIYTEGVTRTNATNGICYITETPLKGMSDVVYLFLKDPTEQRSTVQMTIDDAGHYTEEQKRAVVAAYLPHEREARSKGIPMLGSGRIFPFSEDDIAIDPFDLPKHWGVLGGMDFGIDHPFAAVKLHWDKDTDTTYLTNAYRVRNVTPVGHASSLKLWKCRWAWPHDGLQRDKKSGIQLAQFYRDEGLDLISEHAQYPDDRGNGLEASILDLYKRMESGRFKVFRQLVDWFEEFRMYHRIDGQPVKERDDLISATRYAVMSLRYAEQETELPQSERYKIKTKPKRSWMAS